MRTLLCVITFAFAAPAQNLVVSPIVHTNLEGPSSNTWPWESMGRYQQVHTDLTGVPRSFVGLAWRRNQDFFLPTTSRSRTIELEILMCDANAAAWSGTFTANYVGATVTVFARKLLTTPDWTPLLVQRPAPFDFTILFDAPYPYGGVNDLLYELVVYNSTALQTPFDCDAAGGIGFGGIFGSYTSEGSGCTTGNGKFQLRAYLTHVMPSTVAFSWAAHGAPASASGAVLLGVAALNVRFPGLCTNLYTDAAVLAVPFTSTPPGTMSTRSVSTPYDPTWASVVVSAQAAALDATQPGMPLAASQGVRALIPPPPPAPIGARAWALYNPLASSGTTSTTGWMVTQFRW